MSAREFDYADNWNFAKAFCSFLIISASEKMFQLLSTQSKLSKELWILEIRLVLPEIVYIWWSPAYINRLADCLCSSRSFWNKFQSRGSKEESCWHSLSVLSMRCALLVVWLCFFYAQERKAKESVIFQKSRKLESLVQGALKRKLCSYRWIEQSHTLYYRQSLSSPLLAY